MSILQRRTNLTLPLRNHLHSKKNEFPRGDFILIQIHGSTRITRRLDHKPKKIPGGYIDRHGNRISYFHKNIKVFLMTFKMYQAEKHKPF